MRITKIGSYNVEVRVVGDGIVDKACLRYVISNGSFPSMIVLDNSAISYRSLETL